jgi:hypothetical protein
MLPEALTIETYICLFDEKKDPTWKFWLELTGLTSGVNYTYQYWVGETTPIANSRIGKNVRSIFYVSRLMMMEVFQLQLILICLFIQ